MTNPKTFLIKLTENLNLLHEREAKYAGHAPLDLLNQIRDHQEAITLTEQLLSGEIDQAAWQEALKPLLVSLEARTIINLYHQPRSTPSPPCSPRPLPSSTQGFNLPILALICILACYSK